jgi:tRNA pseudouridine13 synthase
VPRPIPEPSARERALGLGFYASTSPGIGGRIKKEAEDFRVTEVSAYPRPDAAGPFTVLRILSKNWEQHELADALARELELPRRSIQWAGTKDRRAVSERLFSYRGAPPERTPTMPDVEFLDVYPARDGVTLGHHYGNAFAIRVDETARTGAEVSSQCTQILEELRAAHGFPNLFGPQRFGEVRPVTHDVGRALVRGNVAEAVDLYLTEIPEGESGPGVDARRAYASHHDPVRALREFPAAYRFERSMLEHLARGHTPERAFHALSRELRMLFVHAFQSYLFNEWLTLRWREHLPMDAPVAGDTLLRVQRDGTVPGLNPIPVDADNLRECTELVERQRALVAGALVGFETIPAAGRPGELLAEVLAHEVVDPSSFRLPAVPELASPGTWRPIWLPVPPLAWRVVEDGGRSSDSAAIEFRFALPKGAYATVLLREFQKNGASYPSAA